uniref:ZSWIM3 N-terminal domain-containing protein n=1 Tax=Wuchereria bancrofti TaxID=6293 RepID=A0AAF5PQW5_WUCBA
MLQQQEKVTNELNLSMQVGSSTATAKLQGFKEMRNITNRSGSAVEAAARKVWWMKEVEDTSFLHRHNDCQLPSECCGNNKKTTVNEEFGVVKIGNRTGRNKRKPNFVRHIIQDNIEEQSGSKTENVPQHFFDNTEERSADLNNRNSPDQVLDKQSDMVISAEQSHKKRLGKQNGEKIDNSGNASSNAKRKRSESKLLNLNQRYSNRTFSSFTPAEQEELRRKASRIHDGATFQSFDEFCECFEAYKIVWSYPYRVASSELLRDGEGRVISRFKYKYIVFHCAHYGIPRKRGRGERINQNYLSLGCTARFRLNADTTNGCLRISSFHEKHTNHECTEEDYLRIISKKRRNLTGGIASKIVKKEKIEEAGETKSTCKSPELNERANVSDVAEDNSVPVISSAQSSSLIISSQENSAFVPVTRSAEMTEHVDGIQQMSLQNLLPIDSVRKQIFTVRLMDRLQRIEYLIMNAYIIKCGGCLPQEVYLPFICGVYGADYYLSEWSNVQLRDVMIVLLQPPEILLQGNLPTDISIDEVKQVRPPGIHRAITAIREEKLKRCDEIFARFVQHIFNAISRPKFLVAVGEFKKFADDVRNMNVDSIKSHDISMLRC